ncbi:hypothetical protein EW146_g798 [Bondarzewia mesenterica]|uniref:Uncharacterized protein n=1 Tax=Bondarzewia mesenterica TaxID=1095465 RepID=A0A4S4M5Z0_9AGAM|nr:hypothetical protein EW146_g798 [Bondarzewia mesenterica]
MSTSLPLTGKVAIVTGSSRSIGAAIALKLASDGASVVINHVSASSSTLASQLVSQIKASGKGDAVVVKSDVSTVEGGQYLLDQTLRAFGKLDVLVLNAGIMGSRARCSSPKLQHRFFPQVRNTSPPIHHRTDDSTPIEGGRIIFFSSSLTRATTVLPNALVYVASKGAVEQMTRVLAKDLGTHSITVNVVSPGPINTDLFREGKTEQQIQSIANLNPIKRLGTVDEVAPVVAFLASDGSSWVNGQNIHVNGGFAV